MILLALKLAGVRNLAAATVSPGPRFNVIAGDNGQGKTNLLEAIYVAGTLRSFRAQRLAEIIAFGAPQAHIAAHVQRGGLERRYEVTVGPHARGVRLDGKAVRPIARYFGDFNVVLFAPEDLQVPRGSPAERRRFLDRSAFNWRASHLTDAQAYDRVLRSRNALLRELREGGTSGSAGRGPGELLAVYDDQLATLGAQVIETRRSYLAALRPRFQAAFAAIAHMDLAVDLGYQAPTEVVQASFAEGALRNALATLIAAQRGRDLARGASSVGPHRDDLLLSLGDRVAASHASQGQLRALVLAWKTAELDLLHDAHDDPPVLLLDDVSSELDPARNGYLFDFLRSRASQCFITTTHPRHVLLDRDRTDFEASSGLILQRSLPPK
jgi:DNA replication and repair protein RecF